MSCDHNWTIRIYYDANHPPCEFRPRNLSLKISREKYDFCRAEFSPEVGEMLKPHTRYDGGKLYGINAADVVYNSNPVHRLIFRSDYADYTDDATHLEFHDMHKALGDGVVDIQRSSVTLKSIYKTVIEKSDNPIVNNVVFTLPDNQVRKIVGKTSAGGTFSYSNAPIAKASKSDTAKVIDSDYAVDFDQISPEKAIRKLNKKFRVKSWVRKDGTMVVGFPEAKSVRHVAAPRDERVWRYKDPNISHSREPIERIFVQGAWVDESGLDIEGGAKEWFNQGGTSDVIAYGYAERTDVDFGTSASVKASNAKKSALPDLAEVVLKEKMKKQNAGTVEIDPELSGEKVSRVIDLEVGDILHLVPPDEPFDNHDENTGVIGDEPDNPDAICGDIVKNEAYVVSEVEHNVTSSGQWQVFADVGMYPDVPIKSYMSYYDPASDQFVDDSDVEKGWIEGI